MVGSRAVTALAGVAVSLAVSAAAWVYFDTLLVFLVVPFVPLLLRGASGRERDGHGRERGGRPARESRRRCPACGFETTNPDYTHCPRDGRRLEPHSSSS